MSLDLHSFERSIARCRVLLSVAAIVVVYIDAEVPLLSRWISIASGPFMIDPRLFVAMAGYVAYSVAVYVGIRQGWLLEPRLLTRTVWIDVLFGIAVATVTEGVPGPCDPFFAFAVVTAGIRGGLRRAVVVTSVSLVVYLVLILVSTRHGADVYIMRPIYLGIVGYLVSYLGQQRLDLQEQMRQLEIAEQRHQIARDLHDGYAQALSGITLRLESARRMLRANDVAPALDGLTELQEGVNREYDDLRRYARTLAGVEASPNASGDDDAARVSIHADVEGPIEVAEQMLMIAREALRNVRRHARATLARLEMRHDGGRVRMTIDDDGVGIPADVTPWSIASRVNAAGGALELGNGQPGGHLVITIPTVRS